MLIKYNEEFQKIAIPSLGKVTRNPKGEEGYNNQG